jgi:predicted amidohydrolase YtcJ
VAYAPDLILHNGTIITVDSQFSIAQAVAIWDERFLAVGDNAPILALAGQGTRRVDLRGRTVIPGFIDAHFRLLDRATAQMYGADISLTESVAEMLDAIRDVAARIRPGSIITTNAGWYPHMLREQRAPTLAELDKAAPEHPVVLRGEFLFLNSRAMDKFGINAATPQPDYGWIEQDPATGMPTGVLMGDAALLTRGMHSSFSQEQKKDALRWALEACASAGVTTVREGGIEVADLRCYQELWRTGELPIRVCAQLALSTAPPADEILDRFERLQPANPLGDHWIRIDHVAYLFADDDYHRMKVTPLIKGQRVPADRVNRYFRDRCCPLEKIEKIITGMARLGLSGGILAGGDRAIGDILQVLERANLVADLTHRRWVISQAPYPQPQHYSQLRDLGIVLTPMWHHYYYYPALAGYHGEAFAQTMDPFRSLRRAGVRVGLGSDISKVPLNYFAALAYLHTRNTWKWGTVNPDEALTREDALRMLTIDNAYVTFEEDVKGSIEPGKLADFVVLSANPMTVSAEEIPSIRAVATVVGGRVVHREPGNDLALDAPDLQWRGARV